MLQQQFIMLHNKSQIIILLLLCFVTFQAFIDLEVPPIPQNIQNQEYFGYVETSRNRLLQAVSVNDKTASSALKKIVSDSNSYRKSKALPALSESANLNQIISQWSQNMRKSLQLTQYLQLYGIQNAQIEYYASIPLQFIDQVIKNISFSLFDGDYNKVGMLGNDIGKNNYQVIMVFQGGMSAQTITYNQEIIQSSIKNINQGSATGQSQSTTSTVTSNSTTTTTYKLTSGQNTSNDSSVTNNSTVNSSTESIPQNYSNSSSSNPGQPKVNTSQQSKNQSNTTQVDQKPALVQSPPKSNPQPPKTTQTTPINVPVSTYQATTIAPVTPVAPATPVPPIVTNPPPTPYIPVTPLINPSTANQAQAVKPQSTVPSQTISNNPAPQKSSNKTSFVKYPSKSTPAKQLPNKSDTFPNINLYHNVPTTFLKNELFPFKGSITVPNPNGIQVNVILTRISDQQRLPFSQYLTSNETQFYILANMNMTGDYYLSIFVSNSGLTSLTQYTIAPSSIGPFTSKTPTPISNASLTLIGNSLWLNWSYSDPIQPAITQIILTQDNGQAIQFIISNYEGKFKIPYKMFYAFNQGVTNIQISQAFSADQSANSRNSPFSAPFNIIFNATTHHYDIFGSSNTFQPISLRYSKGANITITGPAGAQLQNQVYLITPSKSFLSYYLTANSSNKYVQKGTQINLTINLNETGVYILQINLSGGQALINIPLYVGDIYPLLPDFLDLSPSYIDLAALNQPTLLSDRRSLVLQLINNVRNAYGAPSIYLDNNLNNLAQNYSLTQIQGNFVGHIDRQGRTPNQRAIAAKIYEGVGQNIAMNNNLTNAQLMLQRSPAHLKNMVNPTWTRVGLGILQNSNQFYYLTQQFSSRDFTQYPLTPQQFITIQQNVVNLIRSKYPYLVGQDKVLSSKLQAYQLMDNRPYIISYLQGLGYRNLAVANLQVSYNGGKYLDLIQSSTSFEPTSTAFRQIGIAVSYQNGLLQIFVAYI